MKILLVAERYWPEVGAAPSRLANMAEGLKAKGCEVDVLTSLPNYPKGEIFDGSVPILDLCHGQQIGSCPYGQYVQFRCDDMALCFSP